jgi:hypothetical protein
MNKHFTVIHTEYLHWLKVLGYSEATQGICSNAIKYFFWWLPTQNVHHITKLEHNYIEDYFEYLQTRPNKHNGKTALSRRNRQKVG